MSPQHFYTVLHLLRHQELTFEELRRYCGVSKNALRRWVDAGVTAGLLRMSVRVDEDSTAPGIKPRVYRVADSWGWIGRKP